MGTYDPATSKGTYGFVCISETEWGQGSSGMVWTERRVGLGKGGERTETGLGRTALSERWSSVKSEECLPVGNLRPLAILLEEVIQVCKDVLIKSAEFWPAAVVL